MRTLLAPYGCPFDWHAAVMLNRVMFIYFIQKKGFLDGNTDYLRDRLNQVQEKRGKGKFQTFFRYFLLQLFQEGFSKQKPSRKLDAELTALLGEVPYLNGGLFDLHDLERKHKIDIPDEAFERLFNFFDQYEWHLDTRPLRNDREINPDVLGYIFEKYINQKQMGAYYTKEDITDYIGKNTIVPFLFDAAEQKCKVAFEPKSAMWRALAENPDRFIYPAVRHGVIDLHPPLRGGEGGRGGEVSPVEDPSPLTPLPETERGEIGTIIPLPPEIEKGVKDVSQRGNWNRPAPAPYNLPTETWREHVARRQRCLELREKLQNGEIHKINDLITWNLDIRQFAEDAIEGCEGPELLRAFYYSIAGRLPQKSNEKFQPGISVLDPTCGSGAFLFAALNILEPLYEACLDRMQAFVDDLDRALLPLSASGRGPGGGVSRSSAADLSPPAPLSEAERGEKKGRTTKKFEDFRKVLEDVRRHPSREYFILKSIVVHNLFGVDIMEEAVEICKLRLFLKLVAQIEKVQDLEPLPDIDFNIRPGNTLVGFATFADVERCVMGKLDWDQDLGKLNEEAEIVDGAFRQFHDMQTMFAVDASEFAESKQNLRKRLDALSDQLDLFLAADYRIDTSKPKKYAEWLASHQPFHWFAEFYGIMSRGGFDVIIGNPPFVEYRESKVPYQVLPQAVSTLPSKNLYAFATERSLCILGSHGRLGIILPLAATSVSTTSSLRSAIIGSLVTLWHSSYGFRPAKLFEGVNLRLLILLGDRTSAATKQVFSTSYMLFSSEERSDLFSKLAYVQCPAEHVNRFPKLGDSFELSILRRLLSQKQTVANLLAKKSKFNLVYHRSPLYWIRALDFEPYFESETEDRSVHHLRNLFGATSESAGFVGPLLNSSLFFYWFILFGNCRNLTLQRS